MCARRGGYYSSGSLISSISMHSLSLASPPFPIPLFSRFLCLLSVVTSPPRTVVSFCTQPWPLCRCRITALRKLEVSCLPPGAQASTRSASMVVHSCPRGAVHLHGPPQQISSFSCKTPPQKEENSPTGTTLSKSARRWIVRDQIVASILLPVDSMLLLSLL
jgi:hypothetical protein